MGRPRTKTDEEKRQAANDKSRRARARKNDKNLVVADPEGPKPLSKFDYDFCQAFVQTGKRETAYRMVRPDIKYPHEAAKRMMMRQEIRDHIRKIFEIMSRDRARAAQLSARAALLTLEVADDRLMEVLETRRKTRGEMLTKDVKQLLVEGAEPVEDENGKVVDYNLSPELKVSLLNEGAPVEDSDLLKAIELTYKRKQGIIKAEKPAEAPPVVNLLYKPKWYGGAQAEPEAPMIEGQA